MELTSNHQKIHQKIHLNVEQFSLNANWELTERLLVNQSCKKDPHEPGRKERERVSLGPVPPENYS